MKRICLPVIITLVFAIVFCACTKKEGQIPSEDAVASVTESGVKNKDKGNIDNLTGLYNLDDSAVGKRPVAVMVNNLSDAQAVQTGLNDAGMVFECMVEGGISRLMAVYSDISKVKQIGTIRSARYTYVQLARSLDAIYVHCGMDDIYTRPYANKLSDFDYFDLGAHNGYSFRSSNGLSYEHTLYAYGEKLEDGAYDSFRSDIKSSNKETVFKFSNPEETSPAGTACSSVSYAMSSSYKTTFKYNSETQKFIRQPRGNTQKDYLTGKNIEFKNVFVLFAPVQYFSDNYHVKTILDSGSGYYISDGGYTKITWSKGDASDKLKLKDSSGNDLTVNAGNSWITFVPSDQQSSVSFGTSLEQ